MDNPGQSLESDRGPCPRCGGSIPLIAKVCRFCNLDLVEYDKEVLGGDESDPLMAKIVVRSYKAKTQEKAAAAFQADAAQMAASGYYPISQSWAPGSWGWRHFLLALLLLPILILPGILMFIYLLVVKPDGTLTVTYQQRAATV